MRIRKSVTISCMIILSVVFMAPVPRLAWGQDSMNIGFIGPLSAPGAFEGGMEMKMAAELAGDEINAQGGLLGKKINIISQDTQSLPEKGVAAMERLITKDKVVGVVGEYHSSVAIAAAKVAHKYHVPFIGSECWADEVTALGFPEVFRIAPASSMINDKTASWIVESGFKNVVGIAENSDWGLGTADVITKNLKAKGLPVSFIKSERTVTDFTPHLLKFKSMENRPDLFFQALTGSSCLAMIKQSVETGFAPSKETAFITAASDVIQPEFWATLGEYGLYVVGSEVGLPKTHFNIRTKSFIEAFEKKYNRKPTSIAMEAYDSVWLLAKAIENRASTNPDEIITALENIDYVGTRGLYKFSVSKDPAYHYHQYIEFPFYLFQYTKVGQAPQDAPILYPKRWSNVEVPFFRPE